MRRAMTIEVVDASKEWPPMFHHVIVPGGVGYHDGKRWYSVTDENRPIQWKVTCWAAIPDITQAAEVDE